MQTSRCRPSCWSAASILALSLAACDLFQSKDAALQPEAAPPPKSITPTNLPPPTVAAPAAAAALRTEDEKNTVAIFRAAAPSAVFVTQRKTIVDHLAGRLRDVPAGSGSGFVWDKTGHIVTNYHVVRQAKRLTVTLQNGKSFDAQLVGVEPRKDIAVLKIKAGAKSLTPINLPPPKSELVVGAKAIAIGNPFGLDHTLTTGVISALGREVDGIGGVTIRDMVQTDAAINPGNSGGPLLDSHGRLIGMNTMIFSRSGASAGIGFAVPVRTIARVVPQIIKTGRAEQVGLGIRVDGERRLERRLGIRGVAVLSVSKGTPAALAGLQGIAQTRQGSFLGDVIVKIGKEKVDDYDDLYNALDQHQAGETVEVVVLRNQKQHVLKIKLIRVQ